MELGNAAIRCQSGLQSVAADEADGGGNSDGHGDAEADASGKCDGRRSGCRGGRSSRLVRLGQFGTGESVAW